ncbi:RraA family protein [Slackia heliotrinireducens]|uniref:RraA family protein n=1 Tax=Slackia heliotrinireducens TaxID=84110 RepID=UPI003315AE7E
MADELVERFAKLDTTCVSDAMDRLGVPCGLQGIRPVNEGAVMCGRAFTVHYIPCGVQGGTVGDFLDDVEAGQVIVIDNAGRGYCTVWGDIMSATAQMKGVAGTLIDGVCRDVPTIRELQYPVYSKGAYMVTGKDRVTVDAVNVPVSVSGVAVCPGDIVLADDSGAVVVPAAVAERAAEIAEGISAVESAIVEAVRSGMKLADARQKFGYHTLQTKQD